MPIKITPTRNGKFRVKYYAANGELLAHSEVLNTKQAAKKNIKAMEKLFEKPTDQVVANVAYTRMYMNESKKGSRLV